MTSRPSPGGRPHTRLRPTKTGAGLLLGAALLFGVGTNVQAGWLIVLTALLLGAAAAGAVLPLRALRGVEIDRVAPDAAFAQEPVGVSLVVSNTSRAARGLLLLRDEFLGEGTAVLAHLRPGEPQQVAGVRGGGRRGVHTSGPCELVTGAPFGVVVARRTVELPSRTVVYPRVFDVGGAQRWWGEQTGVAMPRTASAGDTSSVREYRPGDPLRHVHWRSSARTGTLVVREFEDDTGGDLAVVADTAAGPEELDAIASACCSYALAALQAGRRVQLVRHAGGHLDVRSPGDVLDWGARLEAAQPNLPALIAGLPRERSVVCALAAGPLARVAAEELAERARAGTAVLVVLVGTGLDGERSALRAAGAHVVAVPSPERLQDALRGEGAPA